MDFTFDATQQEVADLAATVLRGEPDNARVEQVLAAEPGYDETLWKAMGQAGLLALALPASLGGDGLGPIEVAAVLAEVGRQTMPLPAFATLALGVLPMVAFGTPEQQSALLPEVAHGRVLTAALRDANGTAASCVLEGDVVIVDAVKVGVAYAAQAHRILVTTGAGAVLVDPRAAGLTLTRTPTSTRSPEYTVRLDGVRIGSADVVACEPREVERFALAGAAAMADGVLAGALALTAAHIGTREQFGKPLATFQGVAMQAADVYVAARTMHLVATSANWRLAQGLDADDDLDIAAYWLAAEVLPALQTCHHLHGGLGVDITYPLHRHYSHAKDLARFVGGAASRLDLIGARCSSN
jgi:3-oxo-4-pregnene-20-carboxyl-CoA dehydrogenase alpha subunit